MTHSMTIPSIRMATRHALMLICAVFLIGCHSTTRDVTSPPLAPAINFEIESDFGDEAAWVPEYLSQCAAALVVLMDNPQLDPPDSIKVELRKVEDHPGIAGWAAAPSVEIEDMPGQRHQFFLMGFESAVWPAEHFRRWILAHEMVNLFAHHYGGAGGFPSDFWSNGRSPFPEYLSCVVMRETGYPEDAQWRRGVNIHKPDHALYWTLDNQYGFALFTRFFKLLRNDDVRIGDLGDPETPWPAPDPQRSLYTIAYLSIAAGTNLAPIFREAGVGREPEDWRHGIRSDVPFREYEVRDEDIAAIMAQRERLFGEAAHVSRELEAQRERFRNGEWLAGR